MKNKSARNLRVYKIKLKKTMMKTNKNRRRILGTGKARETLAMLTALQLSS
jgi:hypothetical protein